MNNDQLILHRLDKIEEQVESINHKMDGLATRVHSIESDSDYEKGLKEGRAQSGKFVQWAVGIIIALSGIAAGVLWGTKK
jgi:hypothetical protein